VYGRPTAYFVVKATIPTRIFARSSSVTVLSLRHDLFDHHHELSQQSDPSTIQPTRNISKHPSYSNHRSQPSIQLTRPPIFEEWLEAERSNKQMPENFHRGYIANGRNQNRRLSQPHRLLGPLSPSRVQRAQTLTQSQSMGVLASLSSKFTKSREMSKVHLL
jgi:hypothetical protein